MTANRQLAAQASTIAGQAPRASIERRAALCVAVSLSTTRTPSAARAVLEDGSVPAAVAAAAVALLDTLSHEETASLTGNSSAGSPVLSLIADGAAEYPARIWPTS